jgi:hypothetical protein
MADRVDAIDDAGRSNASGIGFCDSAESPLATT